MAKKPDFWSIFGPKTRRSQIILGTIAELLAAIWSMHDVCEAQKNVFFGRQNSFLQWVLTSLNAHISKYLFSQNGAVFWVTRVVPGILEVCLSMFECV